MSNKLMTVRVTDGKSVEIKEKVVQVPNLSDVYSEASRLDNFDSLFPSINSFRDHIKNLRVTATVSDLEMFAETVLECYESNADDGENFDDLSYETYALVLKNNDKYLLT